MKRVFVEAFEDESRPQGGHAVILVQGLEVVSDRPQFRLKPLDGGFIAGKRGSTRTSLLTPVATRLTESGVELVVGPEIVGHPSLLAGTPVVVELPEAGVRGEFLWPNVAPLAPPKRRNVVVARKSRAETAASASGHDDAAADRSLKDGSLGIDALEANGTADPVSGAAEPGSADVRTILTSQGASGSSASHEGASSEGALSNGAIGSTDPIADKPDATATGAIQWQGRQAARRRARRAWMMPILALVGLGTGATLYMAGGKDPGTGLFAAVARDKSSPPPRQPLAPLAPASRDGEPASGGGASKVAAVSPGGAAPVVSAAANCAKPEITTEAVEGGRMRIRIDAPCKGDEEVRFNYGGASLLYRLDSNGLVDTVIDCFAGASQPVEIRFADGRTKNVAVVTDDLSRMTKVAVVWRAPVNLDLHAFEYAALRGEKGHVFERAPGTASTAARQAEATRRGRGFMSTVDSGRSAGDKLEVYTFLHSGVQSNGMVELALDFETRGNDPAAGTCGTDEHAEVAYRVSVLTGGKEVRSESGRIGAAACGAHITDEARYSRGHLPVIKIRR